MSATWIVPAKWDKKQKTATTLLRDEIQKGRFGAFRCSCFLHIKHDGAPENSTNELNVI